MSGDGDELPYLAQTWNGTNAHHSCRSGRPSDESVHCFQNWITRSLVGVCEAACATYRGKRIHM
jgi:hypothetical protein